MAASPIEAPTPVRPGGQATGRPEGRGQGNRSATPTSRPRPEAPAPGPLGQHLDLLA